MNSELDTDKTERNDASATNGQDKTRGSRRVVGCLLTLLILIGILVGAYFVYMKWFAPEVDPNLKDPDVIVNLDDNVKLIDEGIFTGFTKEAVDSADHPLDPALDLARLGLKRIDEEVKDYTATIVKQIRFNGKLLPVDHIEVKIRHERSDGDEAVPFSVYTKMLSPQKKLGIEAIYVDTWNDNNIAAHPNWTVGNFRLNLPVDGFLAMKEQLHPITMIGIKNLLRQTIGKGERDLQHKECTVEINYNVVVDDRKCLLITITQPVPRDHFEFHIAKIYIDIEHEVPIGYEGYLWPEEEGGEPLLLEKYLYTDLKLNVGLEDIDFSPDNEAYGYPSPAVPRRRK